MMRRWMTTTIASLRAVVSHNVVVELDRFRLEPVLQSAGSFLLLDVQVKPEYDIVCLTVGECVEAATCGQGFPS